MPNRTILLIDYDPQSIESAIKPLTDAGFTVEVANDGVAGLKAFERLHPDLVLIEPMVPKKHGFEVCQEIKGSAHGRSVPVLITTGFYRGRKHQLEAKQFYGCDDYLEKPIAEDLLVSTCRRFLSEDADAPQLLEDLEASVAATSEVPEEVLPALEELSEDEIVARLDALIKEEPELFAEQSAEEIAETPQETPGEGAVVFETEPLTLAGKSAPAGPVDATRTVAGAPAEAEAETPTAEQDAPIPLAAPAAAEYGSPGRARERTKPRPAPKREVLPPKPPPRRSGRLWFLGAAAGLVALAAGGIVLAPRLLRGDDADRIASAAARPAETAPGPARRVTAVADPGPLAARSTEPLSAPEGSPVPSGAEVASETPAAPAATPARTPAETAPPASRPSREPAPRTSGPEPAPRTTTDVPRPAIRSSAEPVVTPARPADEAPPTRAGAGSASPAVPERAAEEAVTGPASRDPRAEPTTAVPSPPEDSPPATGSDAAEAEPGTAERPDVPAALGPAVTLEPAPDDAEQAATAAPPMPIQPVERPKVARGTLLDVSEVDLVPTPLDKPAPEYPPLARKLRFEGTVTLRLLVDENGKVQVVETLDRANDLLNKAAERAARDWTYRPATKEGVPVRVWIVERVVFQL